MCQLVQHMSFSNWMSVLKPCSSYDSNRGISHCNHANLIFLPMCQFHLWFQGVNRHFYGQNQCFHLGTKSKNGTSAKSLNSHDYNTKPHNCCHNCCKAQGVTSNQETKWHVSHWLCIFCLFLLCQNLRWPKYWSAFACTQHIFAAPKKNCSYNSDLNQLEPYLRQNKTRIRLVNL